MTRRFLREALSPGLANKPMILVPVLYATFFKTRAPA